MGGFPIFLWVFCFAIGAFSVLDLSVLGDFSASGDPPFLLFLVDFLFFGGFPVSYFFGFGGFPIFLFSLSFLFF